MKYMTQIPKRRQSKAGNGLVCTRAQFADIS